MARVVVDSSSSFVLTACCAYLHSLAPDGPAMVHVLRPRDPNFTAFCVACDEGSVDYDGHRVHFCIECSDPVASDPKPEPYRQLILTNAPRSVLLDLVNKSIVAHHARLSSPGSSTDGNIVRYTWDSDSESWDGGKRVPRRPLSSLFLPGTAAEDAAADVSSFLSPETQGRYAAMHVMPVRVYMLYGVAGGGKSSLVHTVASVAGCNLATLNFDRDTTDYDVTHALRSLPERSILCIEDIDCLFEKRTNTTHHVSFSSVLAALDGAYTAGPLVVFMTTNALDKLDPAIRRRVDYAVEFGFATKPQCEAMYASFFPGRSDFEALWGLLGQRRHPFSTSVFQKFLVRALGHGNPVECVDVFRGLLECTYGEHRENTMFL